MKTISFNQVFDDISSGTEVYVIMGANLEYNDSTYDMWGGDFLWGKNFYKSESEAFATVVDKIINSYGDLRVYEICENLNLDDFVIQTALELSGSSSAEECELTIANLLNILRTNYGANDHFIYSIFKNLISIVKLEV